MTQLTLYLLETRECTVGIDTGSSDLFVPDVHCGSSCNGHILYDPSESSTASDLEEPFYTEFMDNSSVDGMIYADDVTIAGYTVGLCSSPNAF